MFFEGFAFTDFWDEDPEGGLCPPLTREQIDAAQAALGYRLPESYLWLMERHNGGCPARTCFVLPGGRDFIEICTILGIGGSGAGSLLGSDGLELARAWGYPDIGVPLCDCPSAGHELIFLDYRACGPDGEPAVVHVDQEFDYCITPLADSFEQFLRGLCTQEEAEARTEAPPPAHRGLLGRLLGIR